MVGNLLEDSSSINMTESRSQSLKKSVDDESSEKMPRPPSKSSGLNSYDDDDFESSEAIPVAKKPETKVPSHHSSSIKDSFEDSAALSREFNYEESKESSVKAEEPPPSQKNIIKEMPSPPSVDDESEHYSSTVSKLASAKKEFDQ